MQTERARPVSSECMESVVISLRALQGHLITVYQCVSISEGSFDRNGSPVYSYPDVEMESRHVVRMEALKIGGSDRAQPSGRLTTDPPRRLSFGRPHSVSLASVPSMSMWGNRRQDSRAR